MPLVEIVVPPPAPTNVPAFLAKLWKMVENPDTDDYICWTGDGSSFRIRDQTQFAASLLPYYYKHSNMASFVRQLNMYGFHKVIALHSGNLKSEKEEIEFAHTYFLRGQEFLLDQIKRKSSSSSKAGQQGGQGSFMMQEPVIITKLDPGQDQPPTHTQDMVTEFLAEVGGVKERQEDLDTKMENMRSENEALWGEVLSLRQKHHQQQKIVNKLIQFLSALLQPRGMKRSFGRGPGTSSHVAQLALPLDTEADTAAVPVAAKAPKLAESSGPIIQELPANLDTSQLAAVLSNLHSSPAPEPEQVVEIIVDQGVAPQPAPTASLVSPGPLVQEQGAGASKYMMVDPVSVNSSLVKRPVLQREMSVEDFDTVINTNEKELDNLKDILSGQITLDTSLVSSLFTADQDPNSMPLFSDFMLPESNNDDNTGTSDTGADVKSVTYNPSSFFELADDGDGNILHSSHNSLFDDTVLHTPMIQEDQTDPMKMFKK